MIIYSGNKKLNGGMLDTSYSIEKNKKTKRSDLSFFWKIIQQTGFDDKSHRATFKDGKWKIVKFSRQEIGAMITVFLSSIGNGKITKWSTFHKSENDSTGIVFSYYHKKVEDQNKNDINVFTLQYICGDQKYQCSISAGDMYALKSEVDEALGIFSEIEINEIKKEREAYRKNNTSKSSNNSDDDDDDGDDVAPDFGSEDDDDDDDQGF